MNKLSYLDHLASKAGVLFLGIVVPMACRLIGRLLNIYYGNYPALKPIIWFFTPIIEVDTLWAFGFMSVSCITLVSLEYIFKKIAELVER